MYPRFGSKLGLGVLGRRIFRYLSLLGLLGLLGHLYDFHHKDMVSAIVCYDQDGSPREASASLNRRFKLVALVGLNRCPRYTHGCKALNEGCYLALKVIHARVSVINEAIFKALLL